MRQNRLHFSRSRLQTTVIEKTKIYFLVIADIQYELNETEPIAWLQCVGGGGVLRSCQTQLERSNLLTFLLGCRRGKREPDRPECPPKVCPRYVTLKLENLPETL